MSPPNVPLPLGLPVVVDPDTKQLDPHSLFGGSPARVLKLSTGGAAAWQELQVGTVTTPRAATLGRILTDAGMLHPHPAPATVDVTVVIPVRDRATLLDRALTALGGQRAIVVDDGSADPETVAATATAHGAMLLRRPTNGGPAAARNTGLEESRSEYVAFLDSDCLPPPGWIDALAGHFSDPLVAAAAPRVMAEAVPSSASRYNARFGSLDMGPRPGDVRPGARVGYVPTAALLVRRSALDAVTRGGRVFDPALRVGEDVDLIWRLAAAGWRIRYDPSVQVQHTDPTSWPGLLRRRFCYGTSAAPLAIRHPHAIPPLVLHPLPTLTAAGILTGRPLLALTAAAASVLQLRRRLHAAHVPAHGVLPAVARAGYQTTLGIGRYLDQFATPLLLAAATRPGRTRRAALALLAAPALTAGRAPGLDPVRGAAGRLADDIAYGAGVWTGCLRNRTLRPVRPDVRWQQLRLTTATREP